MSKHGTAAYTEGQLAEFLGASVKALTLIAGDLGTEKMSYYAHNRGEELQHLFLGILRPGALISSAEEARTYPAIGERFMLTFDFDDPAKNDPIEMMCRDENINLKCWQYKGKKMTGRQTGYFKLISIGHCQSFNKLIEVLSQYGAIPAGQWRGAFKVSYPTPDGKGPIGFADPSWKDSFYDNAYFPYIGTDGLSGFRSLYFSLDSSWRWLVRVHE